MEGGGARGGGGGMGKEDAPVIDRRAGDAGDMRR